MLLFGLVALVLLAWSWVDWRDHEIEDAQTIGFSALCVLASLGLALLFGDFLSFGTSLFFACLFGVFGYALYRIDWWGGADVKIVFGLGMLSNPMVFGFVPSPIWPAEVSFFLNVCLASILYFGVAEAFVFLSTGRVEKELPYVPAFCLAWLATGFFGDVLVRGLSLIR